MVEDRNKSKLIQQFGLQYRDMAGTELKPEKITHPFQLMAAWFAMLILLVGVFLTAASKIDRPEWIPSFLVISAVCISVLVVIAVFLMLTRFRPHLQEAKEYAEWLKDERRFRVQTIQTFEVDEIQPQLEIRQPLQDQVPAERRTERLGKSRTARNRRYAVSISYLKRSEDVLLALKRAGFKASIYELVQGSIQFSHYGEESNHQSIWVGSRVTPDMAVLAIKTVIKIWPHLCYLELSGDNSEPPDYVHNQLYFGGSTPTALADGLKPWTLSEFNALPDQMDLSTFHATVRRKYGNPVSNAAHE